jgi:hypothetical protein
MADTEHKLILNEIQETAAQYWAAFHKISVEELIARDFIDGNLVPAYDNAQKQDVLAKYEELPPESKAIVDAEKAANDEEKKALDAEIVAIIEAEHEKIPKPQPPIEEVKL